MKLSKRISMLFLLFLAMGSYSCEKEKEPAEYSPKSPVTKAIVEKSGLVTKVVNDECVEMRDGVKYTRMNVLMGERPQHILVGEVDLTKVTFVASTPDDKNELPKVENARIMPEHAMLCEANGRMVWLAVNGDFWGGTPAVPMGIFIKDGYVLKSTCSNQQDDVVYLTKEGNAGIGKAKDVIAIKDRIYQALGGYGVLVKNSIVNEELTDQIAPSLVVAHPRTAVGLAKNNTKMIIMVVDGRRPGFSDGATIVELAKLMQAAGCEESINLDGGGSSTFCVRTLKDGLPSFPIQNKPTDQYGPRNISNGLLIVDKKH